MPEHYPLEEFNYNDLSLRQRAEQEQFVAAMTHLRAGNDFIVVDSPARIPICRGWDMPPPIH